MAMSTPAPQRHVAISEGSALLVAYREAQKENTALRQENAFLRQENTALRQENALAQQEIRWIDKLLAVPDSVMSPSQKVTLRAASQALQRAGHNSQELIQIESWKLCQTVGQSKDTFLDNLKYLSEKVGVLQKKTERIFTEDGNCTTNLYIGATDLIAYPEQYHVEKPRNHGGERLLCPHCHSDRLQKKVTVTYMGCGAILDQHTSLINKEEAEEPGIPGMVMLQKGQVANPAPASFFAPAQSDLTTDITINQDRQVDDTREEGTPDGALREQKPATPSGECWCNPRRSGQPDAERRSAGGYRRDRTCPYRDVRQGAEEIL